MDDVLEARRQAEAAVEEMTDPELKKVAFQVILQHLLAQTVGPNNDATPPPAVSEDKPAKLKLPGSVSERILSLRDGGFLDPGRSIGEIRNELQAHGWMYAVTALSGPLMKLVRQRELRRVQSNDGGKKVFRYFKP